MADGRTRLSRARQALGVDRPAFAALLGLPFDDYRLLERREGPLPDHIAERVSELVARRDVLRRIEEEAVRPPGFDDPTITTERPLPALTLLSVSVLASGAGSIYLLGTGHVVGGLLAAAAAVLGIPFASGVSRCRFCGARLGWSLLWGRECRKCGATLRARGNTRGRP